MSDDGMDDSIFENDYRDESDAYSPEPKKAKAKAAAAKKPTKAMAPKKMVQTTLTGAKSVSKKRPKPASDDEADDGNFADTPPEAKKQKKAPAKKTGGKPLAEIENDSMILEDGSPAPKGKGAKPKYQKLSQLQHIITRPDMYIGSVERTAQKMWVYNKETKLMENRTISYVPGLYKIFDEIIVNAADQRQNHGKAMTHLKVTIDRSTGVVSVENNGPGIDLSLHEVEKVPIPELIFGHLLAGSNFDDNEKKLVGGRNGYGAKLCNVFSTEFTLECQTKGQKYKQTWTENMSKMGKAKITSNKSADYVRITFHPDFDKFNMPDGIDDDLEALLLRRVYDMAGVLGTCKVYLNGEHIKLDFKDYCRLYAKAISKDRDDVPEGEKPADSEVVIFDKSTEFWDVGFAVSDGSFQQVSFVNSIATTSGGTHVNLVADKICEGLLKELNKRKKGHTLKANHIRNHIFIFVNARIVNPTFNSQTKEQLSLRPNKFGSEPLLSDAFIKKIRATEVIDNIMHFADKKADKQLAKTDGNKRARISNDKLVDANLAGTRHGHECTLILTEGDSAKGLAISGRAILDPDRIGVFPLRGKMLNVRDASIDQISKNAEIQNIKQFLGLKHKQVYTDTKGLRYGHLMIMADQDHDGSHIKGLLINFLEVQFPSLLKIPDFFREFVTPVVKVWQGPNPKKPLRLKSFFTLPQYEEWKKLHQAELRKWSFKYFKGLGTSSNEDAQVYFTNLDDHLKEFNVMTQDESKKFELVFSKKMADARKEWLNTFTDSTYLDHSAKQITYNDFIDKELILFSMADNIRSIPSVIDGFKPGQRKVIYGCFKRNLIKDKKVVELAGYVSENTAYHHGEQSLQQTIVGLAQNFVGSNNINILEPSGNFGSRLAGGSDAASARYIFTRLSPFARRVFSPLDDPNLDYQFDDGKMIEPKVYAPIVPMVLINGADGIGTGWSTAIPNYHPIDIVKNLRRRMGRLDPNDPEEKPFEPMMPWWRGWKGTPEQDEAGRYKFNGIAYRDEINPNEIVIKELPIRMWTDDFKAKLETIIRAEKGPSFIKDYKEFNDHRTVHFVIQLEDKHMEATMKEGILEKFKLTKQVGTSNLVAFDTQGKIRKYQDPQEIMEEFFHWRLNMYTERKQHWLKVYDADLRKLKNQYRFVSEIIDGKLVVSRKKKVALVQELRDRKYEAFPPKIEKKAKSTDEELDQGENQAEEDEDSDVANSARDFDYLLGMPIWALTSERLDKLKQLIAAKRAEYDELDALNEKDLWCKDLDAFEAEWENQMRLDAEIQTSITRMGRRVSKKIGAGKGRRAAKADDDYNPGASKKASKPAAKVKVVERKIEEKQHMRFAEMFSKPKAKKSKTAGGYDSAEDDLSDLDFSALGKADDDAPAAGGRGKRAAATKAKTYTIDDEDDDDDDFLAIAKAEPKEESPAVPSPAADDIEDLYDDDVEEVQPAPRAGSVKPKSAYDMGSDLGMDDIEEIEEKPVVKKSSSMASASAANKPAKRTAAAKAKPIYIDDDESDLDMDEVEEVVEKPVTKKSSLTADKPAKRAAAAKAKPIYKDDDESDFDDDDDDKMLGDVGAMVKGIGGASKSVSGATGGASSGRLSLFAMSRPENASGTQDLPKMLKTKASKSNFNVNDFDSHDDTNYEALAMSSPRKSTAAKDNDDLMSDDDDDLPPLNKLANKPSVSAAAAKSSQLRGGLATTAPAKPKARGRPAGAKNKVKDEAPAKAAAKPKAKATASTHLSPAAKAYAAKKAKAKRVISDDEDDVMEDPPTPVPAARARPGRAAAAKKPIVLDDDDEDEDDFQDADDGADSDDFAEDSD